LAHFSEVEGRGLWGGVAEEEGFGGIGAVECGDEVASVEAGAGVVAVLGAWGAEGVVLAEAGGARVGWSYELLGGEGVGGPDGNFAGGVVAEGEVRVRGEFEVGSGAGGAVRLGLEGGEECNE